MIEILERPAVRHQVAPLSIESYHKLRDLGLVKVKTELLNGVIVEKMTKSPLHTLIAHRLFARLAAGLPPGWQLRKEDPLTLATSEPEPDIAIVAGDIETYREHHPATAELVAEVAGSSVEVDRAKAGLYAAAGVPVYWLVLADERRVEVYSQPSPAGYAVTETRGREETLATWYGTRIPLAELFARDTRARNRRRSSHASRLSSAERDQHPAPDAISVCRKQSMVWSLTMPTACMKA